MNTTALKVFVFNVLGLFAAICGLLLAQGLTHPEKAEAYPAIKHTTGFQQVCHQSAVGNFDPIVSDHSLDPDQPPPVGHRHVFFGATAINNFYTGPTATPPNGGPYPIYNANGTLNDMSQFYRYSTTEDLQAGTSNCKFKSTYRNTNKSAYWAPDLMLKNGKWAGIQSAHVYYRAGNLSDAEIAKMEAFPPGLKMIVRNVPDSSVYWTCNLGTGKDGDTRYDHPQNCIGGSYNTLHIFFPQCGNGDLDTVDPNKYPVNDHRSHMAFPGKDGQCPEKYPIVYPRINFAVQYQAQNAAGAQLSSGDAYTEAHTDAFEAWGDQQNLQDLIDKCIKSGVNCGVEPQP
jgi:Domain of unknown function (DUF1996)